MGKTVTVMLAICLLLAVWAQPAAATSASTCQTKINGDADCNGTVDFIDYFYFVQESHHIPVPAGVSADFNQDGKIDTADRNLVIVTLGGTIQSFTGFFHRIVASLAKFHI